jgi:hypothetical protein
MVDADDGDTAGGSLVFLQGRRSSASHEASTTAGRGRGDRDGPGDRVEYARQVRSNAIVPGWIDTELASGARHWDKFIERNMPRTPARRWGDGKDFAGIAAYLAGPASSYHTGDVITIDGGYYIA